MLAVKAKFFYGATAATTRSRENLRIAVRMRPRLTLDGLRIPYLDSGCFRSSYSDGQDLRFEVENGLRWFRSVAPQQAGWQVCFCPV